ncbi:MAG: hypothetical protein RBJ76_00350 (plasmid) [Stenomitos frigidus ULC029]
MKRRRLLQSSGLFAGSALASSLLPVHRANANIFDTIVDPIKDGVRAVTDKVSPTFEASKSRIHVFNKSSEALYVLPVPNSDWVWADIGFVIASSIPLAVATAGTGTAAAATATVRSLSTFKKLVEVAKWISQATKIPRDINTWAGKASGLKELGETQLKNNALQDLTQAKAFIQRDAVRIEPGSYEEVFKKFAPSGYMSPSGISAAFGAADMTLFIIFESSLDYESNSRKGMVTFNTNNDQSWIVKENEVVRAKYGKIAEEADYDAYGYYRISVGDTLYCSQSLFPGQCLSSPNGTYDLVYNYEGSKELRLYERRKYGVVGRILSPTASESLLWYTLSEAARNTNPGKAQLQNDGNLVVLNDADAVVWDSKTNLSSDNGGCKLTMQDDGNLVIYKADGVTKIWERGPNRW